MTTSTSTSPDFSATTAPPARAVVLLARSVFGIVSAMAIYFAFMADYAINHDAAVMLQVADIMRHGGVPYRDIIEITPPIAPAIHIIPLLISDLTSLSVPNAFDLFVTFLVATACWLSWALLRIGVFEFTATRRLFFLSAWLTGTLCVQLAIDYGQREHLFAVVLLPWLLCRIARYSGACVPLSLSLTTGIVASPFFLQKPFFLAVVAGVDLVMLILYRVPRALVAPETVSLAAWMFGYAAYLIGLPADAREELRFLISFLSKHYGAYDGNFFDAENIYSHIWIAGVALLGTAMLRYYSPKARLQIVAFFAALVFCFAAYLVQGKGWFYHQIPPRMAATTLIAFLLTCPRVESARRQSIPGLRKITASVCVVLLAMPVLYFAAGWQFQRKLRAHYVRVMTSRILIHAFPGDYVTFISSDLRSAYPSMIYAGVNLGSRYNIDFMIPMLYHGERHDPDKPFPYHRPEEQSDIEKLYLKRRAEDIERFHPKFIAIDTADDAQALPPGFRVSEYLAANGWDEILAKDYERRELYAGFQFYQRKKRK